MSLTLADMCRGFLSLGGNREKLHVQCHFCERYKVLNSRGFFAQIQWRLEAIVCTIVECY